MPAESRKTLELAKPLWSTQVRPPHFHCRLPFPSDLAFASVGAFRGQAVEAGERALDVHTAFPACPHSSVAGPCAERYPGVEQVPLEQNFRSSQGKR